MVEVICDTSFLMILASEKIKNISNLETELGSIKFVIPNIVVKELKRLCEGDIHKSKVATAALQLIKDFKKIEISGSYVDDAILSYIKSSKGVVATLDLVLKKKIKELGGSVVSLSNNRIVLEPSKV
ncbi:MAG: twitching motility protein PilT [Marine Group I thaumarchaeote]|nr:MAG: twitching motility protein PilT [Marine Group I thaumarchaeote]